ncbi:MAG: 2-C-methyl-D-erythritol 4-phosphate cytidylyltransferase [Eubacteriaceae bacterium]|nr:2-C-methyl-D-erythritol 4-phosphate cytidylyltransferase [Eubacteriaceae bacterium]
MVFGAILAGGIGSRMRMEGPPKQFLMLGAKPVFIHSVEVFLSCAAISEVYLGVHPLWLEHAQDLLMRYASKPGEVKLAPGGADRSQTLFNVIDMATSSHELNEDSIIVTHDAVRPFVTESIILENISHARQFGACNTVIPAIDTIIESFDGKETHNVPLRKNMYQVQTPQSFNIVKLMGLYAQLSDKQKLELTDACSIFTYSSEKVALAAGDPMNFKITTELDYRIAQSLIASV